MYCRKLMTHVQPWKGTASSRAESDLIRPALAAEGLRRAKTPDAPKNTDNPVGT
jgi:hypothetical protein